MFDYVEFNIVYYIYQKLYYVA